MEDIFLAYLWCFVLSMFTRAVNAASDLNTTTPRRNEVGGEVEVACVSRLPWEVGNGKVRGFA